MVFKFQYFLNKSKTSYHLLYIVIFHHLNFVFFSINFNFIVKVEIL